MNTRPIIAQSITMVSQLEYSLSMREYLCTTLQMGGNTQRIRATYMKELAHMIAKKRKM